LLFSYPAFGFNLAVTTSDGDGAWSAGTYTAQAGETITFACTPSGGVGAYTYVWDFDDVDSYENPETDQNPNHTFDYLGKHFVWVTVTDTGDGDATEKAVLIVNIELSESTPEVNVVTGCGANNLDNTGSSDNKSNLESCITANYTTGLRLIFPAGTYRFDDAQDGSPLRYNGMNIQNQNLEFVGAGAASTILKYYGNLNSGASWDAFIYLRPAATYRYLFRGIDFQLDQDPDNYTVQQLLFGDADTATAYITVEDCGVVNFSKIGQFSQTALRRLNVTGCGNYNGGAGAIETIRFIQDGLASKLYLTNGDDGHSHYFYCSGGSGNFHIVNNYADGSNMAASKWFAQLKSDSHDYNVVGNLVTNITSGLVTTGANDAQAYNANMLNNRVISVGGTSISISSSSANILIDDNFFEDLGSVVLGTGNNGETGLDAAGISLTNNIFGDSAGTDGGGIWSDLCDGEFCTSTVTISGNTDDTTTTKTGDPAGWVSGSAYVDPGAWEYVPPTNNGNSATDGGSGMGSSARFPFQDGALAQGIDGSNNYSEIELYADRSSLFSLGNIRYADVDGNWSDIAASSTLNIKGSIITGGCAGNCP
jgi:hypothetical protein